MTKEDSKKKSGQKSAGLFSKLKAKKTPQKKDDGKLGTFVGVYMPTALTILGVIMYLRFGWVIGNLGLFKAILVVLLAHLITLTTTLSFSAVATNTRVGVGGAYFIISRSLGLELGAAIGLPLFLSQVFSVTLYAFGLAESFRILWADLPLPPVAFVIVLLVGGLAFRGASAALKTQFPVLILITLSLLALGFGAFSMGQGDIFFEPAADSVGFWAVFAVFFPAVTGIMAGLGLSGDLRNPQKAIPRGALTATLTGFAVYMIIPFFLALGASPEDLKNDPMVWAKIAPFGALLILPGLWGAIFSSAVGSMLAAPRTFQALVHDFLPGRFERHEEGSEPILGLVVTLVLAVAAIFLGNLNMVAQVVAMFFLTVYGTINLVAALETLSGDSSWRPKIHIHWIVSLLGAVGSFTVMILINPIAAIAALSIELVLWLLLSRRARHAEWGDARRGVYENLIRWALIQLRKRPMTARNWRPHVLVFVDDIEKRLDLIRFANWFSYKRGVVTTTRLVQGNIECEDFKPTEDRIHMESILRSNGLVGFPEVHMVSTLEQGIIDVAQANGMAGMHSNTVILGWPNERERLVSFVRLQRGLERLNKSLIIGRISPGVASRQDTRRRIDVWWGGLQRNGDLMLLLAYLMSLNPEWRGARIRIISLASNELAKDETQRALDKLLPESRIEAETEIIIKEKDAKVQDIIHEMSSDADIVFLGLATAEPGKEEEYAERLCRLAEGLPSFFFVKNASLFPGELV